VVGDLGLLEVKNLWFALLLLVTAMLHFCCVWMATRRIKSELEQIEKKYAQARK